MNFHRSRSLIESLDFHFCPPPKFNSRVRTQRFVNLFFHAVYKNIWVERKNIFLESRVAL